MSKNLNLCQFTGRLGKDPDARFMPNGNQVTTFTLANGRDYKDKSGNKVERTEWINCVCYGPLAKVVSDWCHKGSMLYISGAMVTDKYDKDGVTHYSTKINVDNMEMLGSKPAGQEPQRQQSQPQRQQSQPQRQQSQPQNNPQSRGPAPPSYEDFDDDIPFMSLNNMIKSHLI